MSLEFKNNFYSKKKQAENQAYSGIPLASIDTNVSGHSMSVFKRKNGGKRLSMINKRQSIIGPPRLSTYGPPSSVIKKIKQYSGEAAAVPALPSSIPTVRGTRKSLAPSVGRNSVRSSRVSVYSSNGNTNSIHHANNVHTTQRDPRPLRDRAYQEEMRQDIYNYLTQHNFEMDTKHLLTEKTLKSPTQKDFVVVFNWLFKQIDPGHKPTRTIESDVTMLLKIVQYPYLDTINKSQISAVGGQNWTVFLGMLHWLVKCSYFNETTENEVDTEEDSQASNDEFDPGERLNDMFFKYIKNAYQLFLMDKDNYEPLKEELQNEFNQYIELIEESVRVVEKEYEELLEKYKKLVKDDEIIENGNRRSQALETDILKFKEYIRSIEARRIKWSANIKKMTLEVESLSNKKLELEKINEEIVSKLTDHGLNLNDVRNLIQDRTSVIREFEDAKKQLDATTIKVRDREQDAKKLFDKLQGLVKDFNIDANNISNIANLDYNFEFDVDIHLDNILDESKLGLRSEELLNGQDLRTLKRTQLKEFNKLVRDKIFKDKDEIIKLQNNIDLANEKLLERKEYYNNLEAKLSSLKIQSEELYNTMTLEANASNTEMEKLESQLQSIRTGADLNLLEMDQKIHSKEIEYDRLTNEVRIKRENMHKEVEKLINGVVNFKMDIQESLEDLESTVDGEYKEEMA